MVDLAICEGLEQITIFHFIERRAPKAIIVLYTIFNKYFHCVEVIIVVIALTESSLFVCLLEITFCCFTHHIFGNDSYKRFINMQKYADCICGVISPF